MLPEKNALSLEEIDEQSALELPQRELLTLFAPRIDIDVTKVTQNSSVWQMNVSLVNFASAQANYADVQQTVLA